MESLGVPCTAVVALDKEDKKPSRVMFDTYIGDKEWKREDSFYIGDALGRKTDFADSDKVFAETIGVPVFAPEDKFASPSTTSTQNVAIQPSNSQEMVIMVGYPGSGKTTIADEVFAKHGYTVLHGDDLRSTARMLRVANAALISGASVVIDATNPSRSKRKEYIDLATSQQIPVRCIYVSASMETSMAQNLKRAVEKQVPKVAYFMFRKHFEEPSKEEGFVEIQKI
jgi:bifunctional polynucleotide phosphatase/kinase